MNVYSRMQRFANGLGMEAHHLIQKRFAECFGVAAGAMMAAALDPGIHQLYDNLWNDEFPYGRPCKDMGEVLSAALEVYEDDPEVMEWLTQWFKIEEMN